VPLSLTVASIFNCGDQKSSIISSRYSKSQFKLVRIRDAWNGGASAEVASAQRAWFRCPRCERDWEVRISDDKVEVLPIVSDFGALRPGMAVQPERVSRQDPVNRQLGGKQEK
jgi:hypothetical protein